MILLRKICPLTTLKLAKMVGVRHEHVNDAKLDLCLNFMHKTCDEI